MGLQNIVSFFASVIKKGHAVPRAKSDGTFDVSWGFAGGYIPQGFWDADTNTPTLADGVGTLNYLYVVNVAGTQDLGHGSVSYTLNDQVVYAASDEWIKLENPIDLWQKTGSDLHPLTDGDNVSLRTGGLKDTNVTTAVLLGDGSNTSLNSTNKTIIGGMNEANRISASDLFTLDGSDISAKKVTLTSTPVNDECVDLKLAYAGEQINGISFEVNGAEVSWNGFDLDGELSVGDKLLINYTKTVT